MWEYDATNDTWTQRATMPTISRKGAAGFTLGNAFYIGTGIDSSNTRIGDFWEYLPDTTTSIQEIKNENFSFVVYPNPAHEKLTVKINSTKECSVLPIIISEHLGHRTVR